MLAKLFVVAVEIVNEVLVQFDVVNVDDHSVVFYLFLYHFVVLLYSLDYYYL